MTAPKLYPKSVYAHPPSDFDNVTEELAVKVKNAVAGFGTDEDALIRELGDEPADHRLKLYYCYKEKFGDDLDKVMQKEMGKGNVGKCMQVRTTQISFEYMVYLLAVYLFVCIFDFWIVLMEFVVFRTHCRSLTHPHLFQLCSSWSCQCIWPRHECCMMP
jgi:hypothetical protein